MSNQNGEERDDEFALYSLLESRIEMLEENVSMLRRELVYIKRMMIDKGRHQ